MRVSPDACQAGLEADTAPAAAQAACLSGVAFAWRSLGRPDVNVEVTSISGGCVPEHMDGFAIAAAYALACSLELEERGAQLVSDEWEVVSAD